MKLLARSTGIDAIVRVTGLFLVVAVAFAVPFALWGDRIEHLFVEGELARRLGEAEGYAWLIVIAALLADLVLPIPNTAVIAAAGIAYGPVAGGLVGAAGSCLSGLAGYAVCRRYGRPAAAWLIGEEGLKEGAWLFSRSGGWMVACSRWLPILPEAIACMAGLVGMPFRCFALALACGSVPLAFVMATAGYLGAGRPLLTLALAALLPVPAWYLLQRTRTGE